MNALVKTTQQFIPVVLGERFSFKADDQEYSNAQLQDIQGGSALIRTQAGQTEAISLESMRLLVTLEPNDRNDNTSTATAVASGGELAIGFPLAGLGLKAYTRQYGGIYGLPEPAFQGAVPELPPSGAPSLTVVTIAVPVVMEIWSYSDGSQNVNVYPADSYPGFRAGPPSRYIPGVTRGEFEQNDKLPQHDAIFRLSYS
ncbi:hypothetical protein ACX0K2_04540 [Pseudomonas extremorientalis]